MFRHIFNLRIVQRIIEHNKRVDSIQECRAGAHELIRDNCFEGSPVQMAIAEDIFQRPELHFEAAGRFPEVYLYVEYKVYSELSVS